ncbi:unnamed protein product, partial [marine sediment metagenome]
MPFDLNPRTPFDPGSDPSVSGIDIFSTAFRWAAGAPGNLSLN